MIFYSHVFSAGGFNWNNYSIIGNFKKSDTHDYCEGKYIEKIPGNTITINLGSSEAILSVQILTYNKKKTNTIQQFREYQPI